MDLSTLPACMLRVVVSEETVDLSVSLQGASHLQQFSSLLLTAKRRHSPETMFSPMNQERAFGGATACTSSIIDEGFSVAF